MPPGRPRRPGGGLRDAADGIRKHPVVGCGQRLPAHAEGPDRTVGPFGWSGRSDRLVAHAAVDADEDRHDKRDVLLAGEEESTEGADDGSDDDGSDDGADHVSQLLLVTGVTVCSARLRKTMCNEFNLPPLGAGVVDVAGVVSMSIRQETSWRGAWRAPRGSARLAAAGEHAVPHDERGCDDDADEAGGPVDPQGVADTGGLVVDERAAERSDGAEDDGGQNAQVLLAGQHQSGERSHDRARDEGGKD